MSALLGLSYRPRWRRQAQELSAITFGKLVKVVKDKVVVKAAVVKDITPHETGPLFNALCF